MQINYNYLALPSNVIVSLVVGKETSVIQQGEIVSKKIVNVLSASWQTDKLTWYQQIFIHRDTRKNLSTAPPLLLDIITVLANPQTTVQFKLQDFCSKCSLLKSPGSGQYYGRSGLVSLLSLVSSFFNHYCLFFVLVSLLSLRTFESLAVSCVSCLSLLRFCCLLYICCF